MGKRFNRRMIFEKTNGHCSYCGCEIDFYNFHVDHIKPINKGGNSKIDNLFPSCCDCNLSKGDSDLEEFRNKIKSYLNKTIHGRMINKYYKVDEKEIKFYFEKEQ